MKYSLNIEPMFPELDFCDRVKAAKDAGFDYIEFWGWSNKDIKKLKEMCNQYGVKVSGFKGDQDWSLCDADSTDEFIAWMKKSIETANYLECDSIITHSNHFGANGSSDFRSRYTPMAHMANMAHTLTMLTPVLEDAGVTLYLEPLNNLGADAGMFLVDVQTTADLIRAVHSPNVRLLCDVFHMQRMHGDLVPNMLKNLDIMNYVHIADSPDRKEPGTGELNYTYILNTLMEHGFDGYFCFEMFPDDMAASLQAADALRATIK